MSVLNGLYESVSQILRRGVEKKAVLDSLDTVMLAVDEICDGGYANISLSVDITMHSYP
jgi:coatomer subunit zeta